jgi:CYTH domain-containing protein/CHAD domain-containing protein
MQEIERKFLVDRLPPELDEDRSQRISQGYLAVDDTIEVRLRRIDDELLITAKRGRGETREEIEAPLEERAFEELWKLTESRRVSKRRFQVPLEDGHCAEVDVYAGGLEGLVVAEVEFSSEEDGNSFRAPEWFGRELTGDHRYANQELAMVGNRERTGLAARHNGHEGRLDRAYRLRPEESPPAGMRRIATGRIDKALERLAEAQEAEDPTSGVHGVRKDLKKLRSELRLLRHELGDDLYRAENDAYREAGRLLSDSRDAEVKVRTLEDIWVRCEETLPRGAADEWLDALREERDGGRSAALGEATKLIEAGRARVGSWPLERESWKLVGPGVERAYRRGRKQMRRTAAEPSAANVHQWRKRVKDLWYQLRILEVATPKKLRGRIEVADRLADALGYHHDLAVLRSDLLLRDLPTVSRPPLVAVIAQRQQELEEEAFDLGDRLYVEKPKRFGKQMRRAWRDNLRRQYP